MTSSPLSDASKSFDADPFAFVRWGQPHRFPVLGDRAARNRYAFAREDLGDAAVAQRCADILFADELADLGADGGRGSAGAVTALDLAGEEIAQFEHPARGMHVFAGSHA